MFHIDQKKPRYSAQKASDGGKYKLFQNLATKFVNFYFSFDFKF